MLDPHLDGTAADMPVHITVTDDRDTWLGPQAQPGRYQVQVNPGTGVVTLTPAPASGHPDRFVDADQHGWLTVSAGHCRTYPAVAGREKWSHRDVYQQWGPIRPVCPLPAVDARRLRLMLAMTKTRAVATVVAALRRLHADCVTADGHARRLVAGQPGSNESALLLQIMSTDPAVAVAGPADDHTAHHIYAILRGWVFDPDRYIEVAENISDVFGEVVDGRGGWGEVNSRHTYRGVLASPLTDLLCSRSAHHDIHL